MPIRKLNQVEWILLFLCIATYFSYPICASAKLQDDLKWRINEIIRNCNEEELNQFGPEAIRYVLEALQSSREFTIREWLLIRFIARTGGEESVHALIELLHHRSPHVRGLVA